MSEILSLGNTLVKRAKEKGADEAEIYMENEKIKEVLVENDQIKMGKSQVKEGVGIRVLIDDKIGFAAVNSFDKDSILPKIDEAISIARSSIKDENNLIPSPKKIEKISGIYDEEAKNFDISDALDHGKNMLKGAKDYDDRFQFSSGTFTSEITNRAIVNSKGIEEEEKFSKFTYDGLGMAVDGYEVSSFDVKRDGVYHIDEIDTEGLGRELAKNTVNSLGAKKGEKFVGTALFATDSLPIILYMGMIRPLNANRVQKGQSKFEGKVGEKITSSRLTVRDDSTTNEGLGCRSFDREGQPTPPIDVIKEGELKNYYHNSYTAKKAGKVSTGHASGDASEMPGIGPTNFVIEPGKKTVERLIEEIEKGILINRFSGNVDPVSGDLSGVVKGGHLIENGEKKYPVRETMISGNIYEMLNKISGLSKKVISRPLFFGGGIITPYIRIEDLSFTSE